MKQVFYLRPNELGRGSQRITILSKYTSILLEPEFFLLGDSELATLK